MRSMMNETEEATTATTKTMVPTTTTTEADTANNNNSSNPHANAAASATTPGKTPNGDRSTIITPGATRNATTAFTLAEAQLYKTKLLD